MSNTARFGTAHVCQRLLGPVVEYRDMSELDTASDHLDAAAEETSDEAASDRLAKLADQLSDLSEPDHGRLARIQAALNELKTGDATDVVDSIEAANDAINEFRSDLEGV